jgi:hypothetical protein
LADPDGHRFERAAANIVKRPRIRCQGASERRIKGKLSPTLGEPMVWAAAVFGVALLGGGAYREYYAENEETQGEGSPLTNILFIGGAALMVGSGMYGMYRLLFG